MAVRVDTWTYDQTLSFTIPGKYTSNGKPIYALFYWKYIRSGTNEEDATYSIKYIVDKTDALYKGTAGNLNATLTYPYDSKDPSASNPDYLQIFNMIEPYQDFDTDNENERTVGNRSFTFSKLYKPFEYVFKMNITDTDFVFNASKKLSISNCFYIFSTGGTIDTDYTVSSNKPFYMAAINPYERDNAGNTSRSFRYRYGIIYQKDDVYTNEEKKYFNTFQYADEQFQKNERAMSDTIVNTGKVISKTNSRRWILFIETTHKNDQNTVLNTDYTYQSHSMIIPNYTYATQQLTKLIKTIGYNSVTYNRLFAGHDNSKLEISLAAGSPTISGKYGADIGSGKIIFKRSGYEETFASINWPSITAENTISMSESPWNDANRATTDFTFSVELKDSRGTSINFEMAAGETNQITVYKYAKPILNPEVVRCTSDGDENPVETKIRIKPNIDSTNSFPIVDPVALSDNVTNRIESTTYKNSGAATGTEYAPATGQNFVVDSGPWNTDTAYVVIIETVDTLGTRISKSVNIPRGNVLLQFPSNGNGLAVGKMISAANSNSLEVGLPLILFDSLRRNTGHKSPNSSEPDKIQENYVIYRHTRTLINNQDSVYNEITFKQAGYYLVIHTGYCESETSGIYLEIDKSRLWDATWYGDESGWATSTNHVFTSSNKATIIGIIYTDNANTATLSLHAISAPNLTSVYGELTTIAIKLDGYDTGI